MATWVRNLTGTPPSGTNADVIGTALLDNATAPGDFDPAGVTAVEISWTVAVTAGALTDDSHNPIENVRLATSALGGNLASNPAVNPAMANITSANSTSSQTASGFTINNSATIADWEAADVYSANADPTGFTVFSQGMGPDGATVSVTAVAVTITYTPAAPTNQTIAAGVASETETTGTVTPTQPPQPLTLETYRFRDHTNANEPLNSTNFGVAENTTVLVNPARRFRLRVSVGGTAAASPYKLQYRKNAEAYADVVINNPGASDLRTTMSPVEIVSQSGYVDQDATTDLLTGGIGSFVAGNGMEMTITSGSITLNNQHTELEWSLWYHHRDSDGTAFFADGDTIDFRVVKSDGTLLDSYTVTPQVTVDIPDGYIGFNSQESPVHSGPFVDTNNNLYELVELNGSIDPAVVMVKSSDGGLTWNPVDQINAPLQGDLEGIDVVQEGDVLHLGHWSTDGTDGIYYHRFNMSDHASPDQWAVVDQVVDNNGGAGLARRDQSISMHVLGNGDLVAFYTYNVAPVTIGYRRRISGVWDSTTTVMFDGANGNWTGGVSVLDPVNEIAYLFAHDDATGALRGKALVTSTWTRQNLFADAETTTGTLVDDDTGTSLSEEMNYVPPTFFDTNKIIIGFREGTNDDVFVTRVITVGSGGSVAARGGTIQDSGVLEDNIGQSRQPVADIVYDSTNQVWYAFFAIQTAGEDGPNNLWYATSSDDGATWSTDTAADGRSWGSRIGTVRGSYFTRNGTNYIGYVYFNASQYEEDFADTAPNLAEAGVIQGFMWYDELNLGGGSGPQTVSAGVASETEAANAVSSVAGAVSASVSVASEVDSAVAVATVIGASVVNVVSVLETETVGAVSSISGSVSIGVVGASELDSVNSATPVPGLVSVAINASSENEVIGATGAVVGAVTVAASVANETETTNAVTASQSAAPQSVAVGASTETDSAESIKNLAVLNVTVASEAETAFSVALAGATSVSVVAASEIEAAGSAAATAGTATGIVSNSLETEAAQGVLGVPGNFNTQAGLVSEIESANNVGVNAGAAPQNIAVNVSSETETAGTAAVVFAIPVAVASVVESCFSVNALTIVAVFVGAASESENAVSLGADNTLNVGASSETETTNIVSPIASVSMGVVAASESETVNAVGVLADAIAVNAGVALESETVNAVGTNVSSPVSGAGESEAGIAQKIAGAWAQDTATTAGGANTVPVGVASENEAVRTVALASATSVSVNVSSEVEAAGEIGYGYAVITYSETEVAGSVATLAAVAVPADVSSESETSNIVGVASPVTVGVFAAAENENVVAVAPVATYAVSIGSSLETEASQNISALFNVPVGAASETESVNSVGVIAGLSTVLVDVAVEIEAARNVFVNAGGAPQARPIGAAAETDSANIVGFVGAITVSPGQIIELENVNAIIVAALKEVTTGVASETEISNPVSPLSSGAPQTIPVVAAVENEVVIATSHTTTINVQANVASEFEETRAVTGLSAVTVLVQTVSEIVEVVAITPVASGAPQTRAVVAASETENVGVAAAISDQNIQVQSAPETESVTLVSTILDALVAASSETEAAGNIDPVPTASVAVGTATETENSYQISSSANLNVSVALVEEIEQVFAIAVEQVARVIVSHVVETESGQIISYVVGVPTVTEAEAGVALRALTKKYVILGSSKENRMDAASKENNLARSSKENAIDYSSSDGTPL